MSLQTKIVYLILVLGTIFGIASYYSLQAGVLPAFYDFEQKEANQSLNRALLAIDAELDALDIINRQYSEWNHTRDFVLGKREQYAEENLDSSSWDLTHMNMMLIFDEQGMLRWGGFQDSIGGFLETPEEELLQPLTPGHPLLDLRGPEDVVQGILLAKKSPILVSSHQILNDQGEGPAAGTLVIGRYLDRTTVLELQQRAGVELSVSAKDDPTLSDHVRQELQLSPGDGVTSHMEYDDERVTGHEILYDLYGSPAVAIHVSSPRVVSGMGRSAAKAAMIYLTGVTLIFLFVAWLVMRNWIVVPLSRLSHHMLRIRRTGDLGRRLETTRSDEIGQLTREFDQLTGELGSVQRELEHARDEALALAKAKSEFLARMSHEIRTPMNGGLGMVELLERTELDGKQQRYAQIIQESGKSLLGVINDLLDFSKIEAGKLTLENITFDLQSFLNDSIDGLSPLAQEKGLTLHCMLPQFASISVVGDPFRLRQILTNLIGNAIKFTHEGSILVRVVSSKAEQGYVNLRFEVADTGVGIAPEMQEKIFDSFAQEDGTTTRRFGGTGLGLAISMQLVEMMGGQLRVQSEPGKGSVFSFSLCMREIYEEELTDSARTLQSGVFKLKVERPQVGSLTGRILLAEDNAVNQAVALGMLSAMGVSVVVANNGREALDQFLSSAFDVVLMDCQMPEMDGFTATQEIREIELSRGDSRTPIIAVTANASSADRDICIDVGMNDYLSKPYTVDQLFNMLSKYLEPGVPLASAASAPKSMGNLLADSSEDTSVALDPEVLDRLAALQQSGSNDLLARVVDAYRTSSKELMDMLASSIDAKDIEEVRKTAHALKSSSANVGAMVMSGLMLSVEKAAGQQDLETAEQMLPRIVEVYQKVIAELDLRMGAPA